MHPRLQSIRTRAAAWLPLLLLLVAFLALRLPGLGRFVTTDEAIWLRRSANFRLALHEQDWAGTLQSPHPGVLTQWAGAAAYQLVFPEYALLGQADIRDPDLLRLMENRGVNPMRVLAAGRALLLLVHAAAFLGASAFAFRILGPGAGGLGAALIALDPFLAGHQRLLHLDGLLASLMLLGILAFVDFLQSRQPASLLAAGLATGLAWLCKTPAIFLAPAVLGLSLLADLRPPRKFPWRQSALAAGVLCLLLAVLVFCAFFPAIWADPVGVLQSMAAYTLGSAEGEYSGPVFFLGQVYPEGEMGAASWVFYPISLLARSTPIALAGMPLALWFVFRREDAQAKKTVLHLGLVALGFMLLMSLASKKMDRYLLPALPFFLLIAGWGWSRLVVRFNGLQSRARQTLAVFAILALSAAVALPNHPYYLNYYNPLIGRAQDVMMIGWGEGLDQAAQYLSRQPNRNQARVAAWYSVSFQLMYPYPVEDIPIASKLTADGLSHLLSMDYLVVYIHQWQRGTPQNLLDALAPLQPEHTVYIGGQEYVRIYRLAD